MTAQSSKKLERSPRSSLAGRTFVVASAMMLLGAVACSSSEDAGPTNNGVNDVKAACEIRAGWTTPTSNECLSCKTVAPMKACGCESFEGFDGVCEAQAIAKKDEPSCTADVDACVNACANDCSCVDGCYANALACKKVAAAVDGCITDTCTKHCTE